jgi:hypothetical protein
VLEEEIQEVVVLRIFPGTLFAIARMQIFLGLGKGKELVLTMSILEGGIRY